MTRRAASAAAILALVVACLAVLLTGWTAWRHAVTDGFSLRPWQASWWSPLTGAAHSVAGHAAATAGGR